MMRSLFSGVSGLKVHQTRMDVIGNNIANVNTIGFKSSRTTFSDMLSQVQRSASAPTDGRGGTNPRQIGLGVDVESIDLVFTDSSPQQTGKNTDLALSGNGLFVLRDGNQSFYTRNGAFMFDESGYYVMPGNGLRVQGWNASDDGVINTNGAATDIIVPVGKTMEATATANIDYTGNLNKESLLISSISYVTATGVTTTDVMTDGGDHNVGTLDANGNIESINVDGVNVIAATLTMKDGSTMHVTSGYYEVGHTVPITTLATVYDSLGGRHEVTVLIDKDYDSEDLVDGVAANEAALETQTAIYTGERAIFTDANGTKHEATKVEDAEGNVTYSYTYTDADGNEQTVTGIAADDDNLSVTTVRYTATRESTGANSTYMYTYTDVNGNEQTVNGIAADDENLSITYNNRWRVYLAPEAGQVGPASENYTNTLTKSEETGNAESDGTSMYATMNDGSVVSYLYFNDRGQFVTNGRDQDAQITFTYGDGNGAAENIAVIDFTGLTQYANSTTSFPITDGNAAGILQSLAIDGSGVITGTYTNGLLRSEAQIAVAQFNNAAGLTKAGTTIYAESNNSGAANIKTISDFGLNVISSALEMSNVDLATEFSDMIITQRGFQANSKVTTVSDEMLETLVNMKR